MRIRDTETGKEGEVPDGWWGADHEDGGEFLWVEHNWGCDCNRALLLARFRGEEEPENPPCGEGRYVLLDPWWERSVTETIETLRGKLKD